MVTRENCRWKIGETKTLPVRTNPKLCSADVYHAYRAKNLAPFLNPIHSDIDNPILFEAEGEIVVEEWDKCGTFELTLIKRIEYTVPTKKQTVLFAVLCAEAVMDIYTDLYPDDRRIEREVAAARLYIDGRDDDARAAAYSARAHARAAYTAHASAAYNAHAYAARAGAYAVRAHYGVRRRATYAGAYAAAYAARATYIAHATYAGNACGYSIDFAELADKAMEINE